jgi:hypothetical protein
MQNSVINETKLIIDKIGESTCGKWRGLTFNKDTNANNKNSDSDNEQKTALDI